MNEYLIPTVVFAVAVVIALSAFLFIALRELDRTRKELREARNEIAVLTLHDEEIRRMYPLADGRKLMKSPRWTEIEEAEEEETNE